MVVSKNQTFSVQRNPFSQIDAIDFRWNRPLACSVGLPARPVRARNPAIIA
jgi:hypothetical protein